MKFGSQTIKNAKGGILAHSLSLPDGKRIRKGVLISEAILKQITDAGIENIIVAMPDKNDVLEDVAATLIAKQLDIKNLKMEEATTGRVNIFAETGGIFAASSEIINALNAIDPGITIATLPDMSCVNAGRLVATIKIIPYAVKSESLEAALALNLENAISLNVFKAKSIGLISTMLPAIKTSVMDKTRNNLEKRLLLSQSVLVDEIRVQHDTASIADAISRLSPKCDMLIIFGASAISDIADCIPEAIENSGGKIIRFGMPVDPGNLILLAKLDDKPIVGAPGCARSIAENGFDWVLNRLMADLDVTTEDIAKMGVGGLLMETGSRPHPREMAAQNTDKTAGLILAAGQSRRMGDINKMTVEVNGKPMVRHVGEAAKASSLDVVYTVTGHKPKEIIQALNGLNIKPINNPDYQTGLSTSLSAGIKDIATSVSRTLVLLGDMPLITSEMINQMIKVSDVNPDHIIVATHSGKRGNPVLWPRRFFGELCNIEGDVGARHIMAANHEHVYEVELGEAASLDLDTPEALKTIASP